MASPLVLAILQPGCVSEAGDDLTTKEGQTGQTDRWHLHGGRYVKQQTASLNLKVDLPFHSDSTMLTCTKETRYD